MEKTGFNKFALSMGTFWLVVFYDASVLTFASQDPAVSSGLISENIPSENDKLVIGKKKAVEAKKNSQQLAEYHFSLAQGYASEGNPDRAIEEYKLTILFDSDSALVYARLSAEYVKKGMLTAAMETAKEAIRHNPKYVDAHLILAGLYAVIREPESAIAEYDVVLLQDPKHEEAAVYKAQVLIESGKLAQAVSGLRRFTKKVADAPLAYYYLGRAEQQQGHSKEAVQAYRNAMKLRPSFSQAALALGFLYEEKKMIFEATAVYKTLFEGSQDVAAANRLATIYLKQEKYSESVPFLQVVESSDPDDMNVRVKLGLVHMELKNHDQAIAQFKKILEKNPDSDRVHYYLGSLYEEKKQVELAISELKQIKSSSSLFSDATLHVAFLLKGQNRLSEAKSVIQDAIRESPKVASLYVFQASLEEDGKNLGKAVKVLESAVREFPEDEKVRYYLGSLYDRQGDVDRGLEQMEAILKINAENVDAMNYIGYAWTQKGVRLNDVEKLLKKAMVLRPENGYVQDSWGWYLLVKGRVNEAVVELEKAAKLKPHEATILEHLGDAYFRSNLRAKALTQYLDAEKFADNEDIKNKVRVKADNIKKEMSESHFVSDHPQTVESYEREPAAEK